MFLWGPAPIRRTLDYLKAGKFIAKEYVRIMEVHYHLHGVKYQSLEQKKNDIFSGLRDFYFWEMQRIQYLNPKLQIVRMLDKMPSPYIRFWLEDGQDVIVDCFGLSRQEILSRIISVVGKSEERLELEKAIQRQIVGDDNPALIGYGRERFCPCEIPGQSPCPAVARNPRFDQLKIDFKS